MSYNGTVDSTLQTLEKKVYYFHVYGYSILNLTSDIVFARDYVLPCDGVYLKSRLSKWLMAVVNGELQRASGLNFERTYVEWVRKYWC
jgi:hypothetical protein